MGSTAVADSPDLSELLAAMYDCVIVPELWPRVSPILARYMESQTVLFGLAKHTGPVNPSPLADFGIGPEVLDYFLANHARTWTRALAMAAVDEPVGIEDLFDVAEFKQSLYYKQFHGPCAGGEVLIAKLIDDAQRISSCSFTRPEPYGVRDVKRLRALCPHLRRIITIAYLFEQRTLERDSFAEVLNHLVAPVIMVDPKRRIVHTNISGQELLAEGRTLSSVRGVLTANDPRSQEGLRRVTGAPDLDAKSLTLEADGGPVTMATVLPLTSGLRATHGRQLSASAAIFVHNQPSSDGGLATALAAAFRLTGAEARVLSALLEGLSLAEVATRHRVSVNTVRSHLARLFEKTGTNRQSDLIRLASSAIPQIRGAKHDNSQGDRR